MTPLRKRFIEDLAIRGRADATIEAYTHHVRRFAQYFDKSPELLGPEEVHRYQVHLVHEKKCSWSHFNQAVCALRFLYSVTLPRPWSVAMIPFGRRPKTVPVVLGSEEVVELLAAVQPLRQRIVLATLYAAGLRLEEGLHLKIEDIDSHRMLLRVTHGKGARQRVVPLSPRLLQELRDYGRVARPQGSWLFPAAPKFDQPISSNTIQKSCQAALKRTNIKQHVTPHTLRHSYATGLLEAGVDLLTIQRLLGHRSFTTTLIYMHVRRPHLNSIPSPLDWLPVDQCPRFAEPKLEPPSQGKRTPQGQETPNPPDPPCSTSSDDTPSGT
jgi:site-specific recombinase XerD